MRNSRPRPARSRPPHSPNRSATAALELVLVLPVLITLISGVVDLGRIIGGDLTLSNAVRVGADYAAAHRYSQQHANDWKARIRQAVLLEAAHLKGFDADRLTVQIDVAIENPAHTIVTVSAAYPLPLSLFWVRPGGAVDLSHSVTTRQIR